MGAWFWNYIDASILNIDLPGSDGHYLWLLEAIYIKTEKINSFFSSENPNFSFRIFKLILKIDFARFLNNFFILFIRCLIVSIHPICLKVTDKSNRFPFPFLYWCNKVKLRGFLLLIIRRIPRSEPGDRNSRETGVLFLLFFKIEKFLANHSLSLIFTILCWLDVPHLKSMVVLLTRLDSISIGMGMLLFTVQRCAFFFVIVF